MTDGVARTVSGHAVASDALPLTSPSARGGIGSWLISTDHKRIGVLYLLTVMLMLTASGIGAAVARPTVLPGDSALGPTSLLLTVHRLIATWFVLVPVLLTVYGTFVLPPMLRSREVAFPRLNLASWYVFTAGAGLILWATVAARVDVLAIVLTPFGARSIGSDVMAAMLGMALVGFSSTLAALNVIVTVHTLRAPELTWRRLPPFAWSAYATSLVLLPAAPVLGIALLLACAEGAFGIAAFDPAHGSGPDLLWRLLRFYVEPAVATIMLPAIGVTSTVVARFSRPHAGSPAVALASILIAMVGFIVWGHHVLGEAMSSDAWLSSSLGLAVTGAVAIALVAWVVAMWRDGASLDTPMIYALGVMGFLIVAAMTLSAGTVAVDLHLADTRFVFGRLQETVAGGLIAAFLAAIYSWWPRMTGRLYPEEVGRVAALAILVGYPLTFFPQHALGYVGIPGRHGASPMEVSIVEMANIAGAFALAVGYVLVFASLLWSLGYGTRAGAGARRRLLQ